MRTVILDIQNLKKFSNERYHKETVWSDEYGRINLLCMKPGQEITTHTHHGNHIWVVIEGKGEFISEGKKEFIDNRKIVIVPPLVDHGIRNNGGDNLVIASIAAAGD